MKKLTHLLLGLAAAFGLSCCDQENTAAAAAPEASTGKVLVAYFSASGNTRGVAERAAEALGADLFEIAPVEPYTDADLDYRNENSRSSVEMRDPASRPAMKAKVEDIGQYDTVLIGYPIWWAEAPHIVYAFVEQHNLAGKTVLPFCTSGTSGLGKSDIHLAEGDPAKADWKPGTRFPAEATGEDVKNWVQKTLAK